MLPHDGSSHRCLCYGEATHGSGPGKHDAERLKGARWLCGIISDGVSAASTLPWTRWRDALRGTPSVKVYARSPLKNKCFVGLVVFTCLSWGGGDSYLYRNIGSF